MKTIESLEAEIASLKQKLGFKDEIIDLWKSNYEEILDFAKEHGV